MSQRIAQLGVLTSAFALLCGMAFAQNLVENGSFEDPNIGGDEDAGPGYLGTDEVPGWTRDGTNGGVNNNDDISPFLGGGREIPDGEQVYFIQRTDPEITLSQEINGLEEGEYYLFVFYSGIRPGNPGMDLVVSLGGEEMVDRQFTNNGQNEPLERVEVAFQYDSETYGENPTLAFTASFEEDTEADTTLVLDHVQIRPPELSGTVNGPTLAVQGEEVVLEADPSEVVGDASFQWFYDGVALEGETDATLELLDVVVDDSGAYSVEITDDLGSTTASFTLEVVEALPLSSVALLSVLGALMLALGVFTLRRARA